MRLNTFFTRLWRGIVTAAKSLKVNPRATMEGTLESLDDAIRIVGEVAPILGPDAAKALKKLTTARKQAAKLLEAIRIAEAATGESG